MENIKLQVPKQYQQQYLKLLLQNHEAVSQDKFHLGRTDTLMHKIALKTEEPIYIKQFKIQMHTEKKLNDKSLNGSSLESFNQAAAATTAPSLPS